MAKKQNKIIKKPEIEDYFKEVGMGKRYRQFDITQYKKDISDYCKELERQKTKAINALAKVGCENCPKYKYCCKHHTTVYGCKKVLKQYLERH